MPNLFQLIFDLVDYFGRFVVLTDFNMILKSTNFRNNLFLKFQIYFEFVIFIVIIDPIPN